VLAYAPFGFLFPDPHDVQLVRVITIFLVTVLILYLLKRYEPKN